MQGIEHTIRRLIETSLSDGVNCIHNSCVANLSYTSELIMSNNVYSMFILPNAGYKEVGPTVYVV